MDTWLPPVESELRESEAPAAVSVVFCVKGNAGEHGCCRGHGGAARNLSDSNRLTRLYIV